MTNFASGCINFCMKTINKISTIQNISKCRQCIAWYVVHLIIFGRKFKTNAVSKNLTLINIYF